MSSFSLTSKSAIVTGASSGIGAEIAREFAHAGANVVLVARNDQRLAEVERSILEAGGQCSRAAVDLTCSDAPEKIIGTAIAAFGSLNILVNVAGIFEYAPFEQTSLESLDRQWAVNVRAPFALSQAALPHLRPDGIIIFLSSVAGIVGFPEATAYCATKGAVEQLTRALAMELAGQGIRVNAIAPGEISTPMNRELHADPEFLAMAIEQTPAGRIGTVEDVAPCAVFLASDAAKFIHGATFVVDGGWLAQ